MDDETLFGPVAYHLNLSDAIDLGLLADYQILVPVVTDTDLRDWLATGAGAGVERNGRTDREVAVQHSCADSPLPRVTLEKLSGQTYRIQWYHPAAGKGTECLAVDDASTSSGALLAPRDCADSNSQKFRLEASGGGFRLRPLHSGLCIGFLPPVEDGAEAVQTACTGTSDQVFTFTAN